MGRGWGAQFAGEESEEKVEEDVTTEEAEAEFKRVFEECLENNFDLAAATTAAKRAMRAALGIIDSEDEEEDDDDDDGEGGEESFPPLGISIVTPPSGDGGKVGRPIIHIWRESEALLPSRREPTGARCVRRIYSLRWGGANTEYCSPIN